MKNYLLLERIKIYLLNKCIELVKQNEIKNIEFLVRKHKKKSRTCFHHQDY